MSDNDVFELFLYDSFLLNSYNIISANETQVYPSSNTKFVIAIALEKYSVTEGVYLSYVLNKDKLDSCRISFFNRLTNANYEV
jgi:hypothetical protein